MGQKTEIAWCDATWSPVRGCTRVSRGCEHCYAERMAARNLPGLNSPRTGLPFAVMTPSGPHWTGRVELIESQLEVPLRWKKPRRIFVNSMSDSFHEGLPDEAIDRIFAVMALCPQHTFLLLTKRPERMREWFGGNRGRHVNDLASEGVSLWEDRAADALMDRWRWPLPNVWLGTSVEDQKAADERIPLLLQTPAAVRFISLEPMLGEVSFRWAKWAPIKPHPATNNHLDGLKGISLVITGGESGPGARPCDVSWIRSVVRQCQAAGVACFVKQLGANPIYLPGPSPTMTLPYRVSDKKGGDPAEWPIDLRVRQMPEVKP